MFTWLTGREIPLAEAIETLPSGALVRRGNEWGRVRSTEGKTLVVDKGEGFFFQQHPTTAEPLRVPGIIGAFTHRRITFSR